MNNLPPIEIDQAQDYFIRNSFNDFKIPEITEIKVPITGSEKDINKTACFIQYRSGYTWACTVS